MNKPLTTKKPHQKVANKSVIGSIKGGIRHPKANKRTGSQLDADKLLIERWALEGCNCQTIADRLAEVRPYKLSAVQIWQDLKKLRKQWVEETKTERGEAIARELKRLDRQEEELWGEWQRSKDNATTKTTETIIIKLNGKKKKLEVKASKQDAVRVTDKIEGRTAQAAYMKLIQDIGVARRDLLGLDPPKKTALTTPDGESPYEFLVKMDDKEMP